MSFPLDIAPPKRMELSSEQGFFLWILHRQNLWNYPVNNVFSYGSCYPPFEQQEPGLQWNTALLTLVIRSAWLKLGCNLTCSCPQNVAL